MLCSAFPCLPTDEGKLFWSDNYYYINNGDQICLMLLKSVMKESKGSDDPTSRMTKNEKDVKAQ